MSSYHCSTTPVSRASGRSAVAAAAYRAGVELENHRDGVIHDYSHKRGVDHTEIILPKNREFAWAMDRSKLWNAAEAAEKRKDARTAREIVVALPHELSAEQRLALTRDFAQALADHYGVAADVAIHQPNRQGDERNRHAHILLTTRAVEADGLAAKKALLETQDKKLRELGEPTTTEQIRQIRENWQDIANHHLALAGIDARLDCRSHADRGIELEPTEKQGAAATAMQRRGIAVDRQAMEPDAAERNAEKILVDPDRLLAVITAEKSVFDRRDMARAVNRYVTPEQFQACYAAVQAAPALVELAAEQTTKAGFQPARYSTHELIEAEQRMMVSADRMAADPAYQDGARVAQRVMQRSSIQLSDEQAEAVRHVTGRARLAAVVGLAGAGKSTAMQTAREVWEKQGCRVRGAALSGKAAQGLQDSSGIESRTLASLTYAWDKGRDQLQRGAVLVIDEAGMLDSRLLSRVIQHADQAGAKIVLAGDPEQLQPIGPGAAYRAICERTGFAEMTGVRRQREGWQRAASQQFGQHQTAAALAAYDQHGHIHIQGDQAEVVASITNKYVEHMQAKPDESRLVLAHRNKDVQALNAAIREARQARGGLPDERTYKTEQGERAFAVGDRLLFRKNDRGIGVKNGMLATVEVVSRDRLSVALDDGGRVTFDVNEYGHFDHGYAATIHKSQGATVDRVFGMASPSMDRHLAYVQMTRHRAQVDLFAAVADFSTTGDHGEAGRALYERLSQKRTKETTLDYAERHGIEVAPVEAEVTPDVSDVLAEARAGMGDLRADFEKAREADHQKRMSQVDEVTRKDPAYEPERTERQRGHEADGPSLGL